MSKLKVHAGDFSTLSPQNSFSKSWGSSDGVFRLWSEKSTWGTESIASSELEYLQLANEETVKKIGGTVGWGAAGGLIFGPVGLLAGLVLGGRKKEVTFVAKFKDGRRFIATTDSATWTQIQAAALHLI